MGTDFSSTNLGEVNDVWKVEAAKTAGASYLKNVGREAYLEWFEEKNFWSSYYNNSNEERFALNFYVKVGEVCEHPEITAHAAVDPTCTENGNIAYWSCEDCWKRFADAEGNMPITHSATIIAASGHVPIIDAAIEPTCTETGLTEGKHCGRCDFVLLAQETVDALGHLEVVDAAVAPTCTETGLTEGKHCGRCDFVLLAQETVDALGHLEVVDAAVAPTCTETGLTEGKHCGRCDFVLLAQETVNALGHLEVVDAAVAPTCTETGLTEGKHCSRCDLILIAQETVEELGHSYEDTVVEPTCTADGYTRHDCTRCTYSYTDTQVAALGHSYKDTVIDPTCTAEGYTKHDCIRCTHSYTDTPVAALGHSYKDTVIDPTCTAEGYTKHDCIRCTHSYTDTPVAALGHSYEDTVVEPTCTADGYTKHDCIRCTYSYTDTPVAALGHSYKDTIIDPTCTAEGYTKHDCIRCTHSYTDTPVAASGHSYKDTVVEPNCTANGYTEHVCQVCGDKYRDATVAALGHDYEATEIVPTCVAEGYTTYNCLRCEHSYRGDYLPATGHTYDEWVVEKDATILSEGRRYRECCICEHKEAEIIPCVEVDITNNSAYGMAVLTVVHAQTLDPIEDAQIFISTENDGENTFVTDENGQVAIVLPVGDQSISVYAPGCLTRNLTVSILAGENRVPQIGLSEIPVYDAQITSKEMTLEEIIEAGIDINDPSNQHVFKYELHLGFEAEIDWASIIAYFNTDGKFLGGFNIDTGDGEDEDDDDDDDDHDHEPEYRLHYHVADGWGMHSWCETVDVKLGETVSLDYHPWRMDHEDYIFDSWYADRSYTQKISTVTIEDERTEVYARWIYIGEEEEKKPDPIRIKDEAGEEVQVYPVSENFFLIIRGGVRWLKEIFDVQMLVINNSQTDTLEDLTATLNLPEGLSLAAMVEGEQSLSQQIEHIAEGANETVNWYVRGDEAGSYSVEARLQGTVMPFNEPIDQTYYGENQIQVWAGNALHLEFEFPNAAYHGEDYPIKVSLKNVSGKSLYNVSQFISVVQGMEVFYSDGTRKEKISSSDTQIIRATELRPGDQLIIEMSVNIFFKSEIMEAKLQKLVGFVNGVEQVLNAFKAVETGVNAFNALVNCVKNCCEKLADISIDVVSDVKEKRELFKVLYSEISGLALKYSSTDNDTMDSALKLADTGIKETLDALTLDPVEWLKEHKVEDIKEIIDQVKSFKDSLSKKEEKESSRKFDIFDSLRTMISAIPIRFVLSEVVLIEDENNTTRIPWSYKISEASPQYFGVTSVGEYISSFVRAVAGDVYDENVPWYVQLIPALDDPFKYDEAVKYLHATEDEIARIKAKDATGEVRFSAWIEEAQPSTRNAATESFVLASDNPTAVFENGVLTFTGDGTIMVTPKNMNGGTLYIRDSYDNLYTYVIDVVPAHECAAGEQEVIIVPSAEYDGFAIKSCEVCDDILEIIPLAAESLCETHSYSDWATDLEASCSTMGMENRTCSVCGMTETRFTEKPAHTFNTWQTTAEATCTAQGEESSVCEICGETTTRTTEKLPHEEGEWRVVLNATPKQEGKTELHCKNCDEIMSTEVLAMLEAPKFKSASLVLQDDLTMKFKVSQELLENNDYTDPYVVCVFNGVTTILREYTLADGLLSFDFENIIPHQMNDLVSATLHITCNGEEYTSETLEYGVVTYCYNMLAKLDPAEDSELCTLLVDLLNYGAYSQRYMNYKTNTLANANLTEEQMAMGTSTDRELISVRNAAYETIDNPTVQWKSAGLNLQKSVSMRFKIAADDIEGLCVKVESNVGEWFISADTFEETTGGWYFYLNGMNAAQMSETVYVTVYKGETVVSNTLRYSIESYAHSKQNDANAKLAELVKAMMRYGDSARAYMN